MMRSNKCPQGEPIGFGSRAELDDLLHPARAFGHPMDVVNDPDLTVCEKRSILAAWASDACAIEARNELRTHGNATARWDDIMDALRLLEWGVDGLITDRPDIIVPMVRQQRLPTT